MKIYQVGGSVRDELLGIDVVDHDWVVVGSSVEEMLSAGFVQVGKDFPVFLHPKTKEEYALARIERKISKGYKGFSCDVSKKVTLEEDLGRRDLTINAIAKDENGKIFDPYNGKADLDAKVLRHVSPAFIEDPVRILRVARFAARFKHLGFSVSESTIDLMKAMVASGEIDSLVPERVWREIERALKEHNPEEFFLVLRECGALKVIFPALDKLWGVPQRADYHPEVDTGVHVMMALQQAVLMSTSSVVRFAVLCHDLGKGLTPVGELPSHHGHEGRGVGLIKEWCAKFKVPNSHTNLAIVVSKWHLHSHKMFELKASTVLKLLKALDAFRRPENVENYILACTADAKGRLGLENKPYPQAELLRAYFKAAVAVDAKKYIEQGITGAKIGQMLDKDRVKALKQIDKTQFEACP